MLPQYRNSYDHTLAKIQREREKRDAYLDALVKDADRWTTSHHVRHPVIMMGILNQYWRTYSRLYPEAL